MATKAANANSNTKKMSVQEAAQKYSLLRQDMKSIAQKIGELESEHDEHRLVLNTLKETDADRKCFRLIGGVLVERTVKDVMPAVETNAAGLKTILESLLKQYKDKEIESAKLEREASS